MLLGPAAFSDCFIGAASLAKDHIPNARPLLTLATPLKAIPEFWLKHVEHRIIRPRASRCWFWEGMLDGNGEPIVKLVSPLDSKRRVHQLKRIVAAMFWDLLKHYEILHACGNTNCLNPKHFYVTAVNWQQHNRPHILRRLRAEIKRMQPSG